MLHIYMFVSTFIGTTVTFILLSVFSIMANCLFCGVLIWCIYEKCKMPGNPVMDKPNNKEAEKTPIINSQPSTNSPA